MRIRCLASASILVVATLYACSTSGEPQGPAVKLLKIGRASVTHTLGPTSGMQPVTATAVGMPPVTFITFAVGPAAVLAKIPLDSEVRTTGSNVLHTVEARDAQGAPRAGVTIQWNVTGGGGGTITPPTNATGADGRASVTHLVGTTTGTESVTAAAPEIGAGSSLVRFTTFVSAAVSPTSNNQWSPASVTIKQGEYVTWYGVVMVPHNVTFSTPGAPANIPNMTIGSAARRFDTTGTFNYECTNHPGMTGSVTVNP